MSSSGSYRGGPGGQGSHRGDRGPRSGRWPRGGGGRGRGGHQAHRIICSHCRGYDHKAGACSNPKFISPNEVVHYDFESEHISNNSDLALQSVTAYVKEVLSEAGETDPGNDRVVQEKHLRGLRTGFGRYSIADRDPNIATNYLRIQCKSDRLYVYQIDMIWETYQDENNEIKIVYLKDRICREDIFQQLRQKPERQSLAQHTGSWVSDYNMIWSMVPLFQEHSTLPSFQDMGSYDILHRRHTIESVTITQRPDFDLAMPASGSPG